MSGLIDCKTKGAAVGDLLNSETLAAIEDASIGNVQRYASLDTMWTDLGEEQENKELNAIADERLNDGQSPIRLSLEEL